MTRIGIGVSTCFSGIVNAGAGSISAILSGCPGRIETAALPQLVSLSVVAQHKDEASPGTNLTYLWTMDTKPVGSSATLTTPTTNSTTYTADLRGNYLVTCLITHTPTGDTKKVRCSTIANTTPVAVASVSDGFMDVSLPLTGSGSTGTNLSYLWEIVSAPAGSSATIDAPTQADTSITPDVTGDYTFRLSVTDDLGESSSDTATSTVSEAPPDLMVPQPVLYMICDEANIVYDFATEVRSWTSSEGSAFLFQRLGGGRFTTTVNDADMNNQTTISGSGDDVIPVTNVVVPIP